MTPPNNPQSGPTGNQPDDKSLDRGHSTSELAPTHQDASEEELKASDRLDQLIRPLDDGAVGDGKGGDGKGELGEADAGAATPQHGAALVARMAAVREELRAVEPLPRDRADQMVSEAMAAASSLAADAPVGAADVVELGSGHSSNSTRPPKRDSRARPWLAAAAAAVVLVVAGVWAVSNETRNTDEFSSQAGRATAESPDSLAGSPQDPATGPPAGDQPGADSGASAEAEVERGGEPSTGDTATDDGNPAESEPDPVERPTPLTPWSVLFWRLIQPILESLTP